MFSNYDDFILERLIQESIIYFSPELRKKLKRMKSDLSKDLLDVETKDIKDDITFIDVDKDGYVSYNTMKNAAKLLQDTYPHLVDKIQNQVDRDLIDNIYIHDKENRDKAPGLYTKSRSKIKFGRLINKILPGKYTPGDIEEFTNKWKASLENVGEKFQLIEGNDIAYWYKSENYKEERGSLGNSCMRGNSDETFRIYTMNPEICKMLILTDGDELVGRAIVWKVTEKQKGDFEWFMDRQYTISDADVEKFRSYAIEQGWAYKTNNNHHSYLNVTWKSGEDVTSAGVKMSIKLNPFRGESDYDYGRYPYVDTFRRYNPNTGWLYNDDEQEDGCYLLDDTGGGFSECQSGVWSEWSDENIPEDEAVYSDQVDSYLWVDRAVLVERGSRRNRGWYPEGHDSIVYDEWSDDYINVDDAIYSDAYGYYILSDDSVSAIYKIDSDGEPNSDEYYVHNEDRDYISISDVSDTTWYNKLSQEYKAWEEGHRHTEISTDLLTRDFEGEWIPKIYSMKAYTIENNTYEVPFLSSMDAKILDADVNKEKPIIVDKFKYNDYIKVLYPEILKIAGKKIEDLKSEEQKQNEIIDALDTRIEEIDNETWASWKKSED
jgi:hypothetical protein